MSADAAAPPARAARGGGFQRLVLWLLILCLLAVVWWLASERNERHFRLAADSGYLVVERGRFFPTSTARIGAEDPTYGKVYGPLQLPPGAKVAELEYDDQAALDRGYFDQLLPWARDAAKKSDFAAAQALADRASLLGGLSGQQQAQLAALRGELAYSQARGELAQAARLVLSARRKLELVRDAAAEHALEAAPLASELGPLVDQLAAAAEGRATRAAAPVPAAPALDAGSSPPGAGTAAPAANPAGAVPATGTAPPALPTSTAPTAPPPTPAPPAAAPPRK